MCVPSRPEVRRNAIVAERSIISKRWHSVCMARNSEVYRVNFVITKSHTATLKPKRVAYEVAACRDEGMQHNVPN